MGRAPCFVWGHSRPRCKADGLGCSAVHKWVKGQMGHFEQDNQVCPVHLPSLPNSLVMKTIGFISCVASSFAPTTGCLYPLFTVLNN